MKHKFKAGDKVKFVCTKNEVNGSLTVGKVYVVVNVNYDGSPNIKNDRGVVSSYMDYRFELANPSIEDLIEKAKNLIGKTVRDTNSGDIFVPDAWGIANKYSDLKIAKNIKGEDVVLYVENDDNICEVGENLEIVNNVITLTDDYNATIEKDVVNVGCQSIPIEKVRELLKIWESLHG
jgi:hypothetical protein